jgi:hypothetical protein
VKTEINQKSIPISAPGIKNRRNLPSERAVNALLIPIICS